MPYEIPEFLDGTVQLLPPPGKDRPVAVFADIRQEVSEPELRGQDLPLACRGAACQADALLDGIRSRFRVLYPGPNGQASLRGRHLLILLPERDFRSLSATHWLLQQHGDFSGKTGKVLLTQQAREWLGVMRGAENLARPHVNFHQHASNNYEKVGAELAALVARERLGAPPRLNGNPIDIEGQFRQWTLQAQTRAPEVRASLENQVHKLMTLYQMMGDESLLHSVSGQGMEQGLTISVLTGADARLDNHILAKPLPGIVVQPAGYQAHGKWTVDDLKATLVRDQALDVSVFVDVNNRPCRLDSSLQGRLLLVAVDGDGALREQAQGRLLSTLVQSPSGKAPVTLINLRPNFYAHKRGQESLYLRDALSSKVDEARASWRKLLQELVQFLAQHASKPIDLQAMQKLDGDGFVEEARAALQVMPKTQRDQGFQLLAEYEKATRHSERLTWRQMQSRLHEIAGVMDKSANPDEVHVLFLSMEGVQVLLTRLPQEPDLMAGFEHRLLAARIRPNGKMPAKRGQADGPVAPCRGRDCSGDQLLEAMGTRFQIVLRNLRGRETLAHKNILILLPEQDATQIALVKWLLEIHADFSGKSGEVFMNPSARAWLGDPAGTRDIEASRLESASHWSALVDREVQRINAFVLREHLGEPLRYKGASMAEIQGQFEAWMDKRSGDADLRGRLTLQLDMLKNLLGALMDDMLPRHPPGPTHVHHLSFTVLAGPDAQMDWAQRELRFPGLVVTPSKNAIPPGQPSAQWSVGELSASLRRKHNLKVELFDLDGQLLPGARTLDRVLLLTGVEGDADGAGEIATRLVRGLLKNSKGEIPVNLLKIADTVNVAPQGQTEGTLKDSGFARSAQELTLLNQFRDQLITHLSQHAKPALDPQSARQASPKTLIAEARTRMERMSNPVTRGQANTLLLQFEAQVAKLLETHTARWEEVFAELLDAMDRASRPKGVHMLNLPAESMRIATALLRKSRWAQALSERIVLVKVAEVASQVPLSPKIEVM